MLNAFDIIVLSIVVLSSLLALFRGFLREMLSLAAWIGAAVITFATYDTVGKALARYITHEMLALAVGALGVFIASLILLSILNMFIMKAAQKAEIGPIDRSLGFAFGLLRGLFIVSLGYMVFAVVMAKEHKPEWVESSRTGHLVEAGANLLGTIAPGMLQEVESISTLVKERDGARKIAHTKEPGFIDAILIRQSFSALSAAEKDGLRTITDAIPAMQLPRSVNDPSALSTKEASNLLINMTRLYRQLQKQDKLLVTAGKPAPVIDAKTLGSLEDKLMVIYMQARDVPLAAKGDGSGKPSGYSQEQVEKMQELLHQLQPSKD